MPVAKTLIWIYLLSSPQAKTHTHQHTDTYSVHVSTHIYGDTQRETHTQGKATGHTHTPLLWQEQTLTQAPKLDVIFHVPCPFWPAVNVNYKPYNPKFGTYPILYTPYDPQRDTSSIKKMLSWHRFDINIIILHKHLCKRLNAILNFEIISQTRKTVLVLKR